MVSSKVSKRQSSKVSSSAALSSTNITQKSSIFRSLFSPSHYELLLFASVIQGLDGQYLRIHDVSSGRLRCEHAIKSKATINCLDWGHYGENHPDRHHRESNKKRKRGGPTNGSSPKSKDLVLAFGTSESEILLFSPTESKVLRILKGECAQGIKDFKFVESGINGQGWSLGGDGKLVQWDLHKAQSIRSFNAPGPSIATLCPLQTSVLCASHTTYLVDPESSTQPPSFTTSSNPVRLIRASSLSKAIQASFLTISESERSVNVFSIANRKLIGTLLPGAEPTSVSLSLSNKRSTIKKANKDNVDQVVFPDQILAVVNKDGILELFSSPFDFAQNPQHEIESVKARVKQMTRRPQAIVKVTRPDSSSHVPLLDCSFDGDDLVMVWTEGGVNLAFNRVKWRDENTGKLLLQGTNELVRAKGAAGVSAVVTNGVKDVGRSNVDESHTVVANGQGAGGLLSGADPSSAIDISSAEEESEYSEDEDQEQTTKIEPIPVSQEPPQNDDDISMEDANSEVDTVTGASDETASREEAGEPSFGEMIRANASEDIDVQSKPTSAKPRSFASPGERSLQIPSGLSLGTVLTQSLRTNDVNLLETCFHFRDLVTVRTTIQRIDSSLATILLDRLAERLHSRPGRAGSLMVWIQWTLVAHGGYLASQPELMRKLASLYRVVGERASSLQSLLALKGKLDMLEAQMNLRKAMQARSRANALDDDDEEGVIYVEGQEDSESEDEVRNPSTNEPITRTPSDNCLLREEESGMEESGGEFEPEGEDDESRITNGVIPDSEDDGSESEGEDLIDDEAESTDMDSGEEFAKGEVDYDDVDSVSASSSNPDDAPPAKRPAKPKLVNGTGRRMR